VSIYLNVNFEKNDLYISFELNTVLQFQSSSSIYSIRKVFGSYFNVSDIAIPMIIVSVVCTYLNSTLLS